MTGLRTEETEVENIRYLPGIENTRLEGGVAANRPTGRENGPIGRWLPS